jgi:2-iminobutanoate/2-iminopropanoate deaminase
MKQTIISSKNAPKAIGPYSQAVAAGDFVFLSGQIPLDPATGEMVEGGVETQTARVMENLGAILREAGLGFETVVKCTLYLADLGDFAAVNEVYGRYFPADPPARACVQVAALPKGARVEIDAIAARGL